MPRIILIYTQSSETEERETKRTAPIQVAHPPVTQGPIFQENAILNIHKKLKNGTKQKFSILSKAWETIGIGCDQLQFLCSTCYTALAKFLNLVGPQRYGITLQIRTFNSWDFQIKNQVYFNTRPLLIDQTQYNVDELYGVKLIIHVDLLEYDLPFHTLVFQCLPCFLLQCLFLLD